MGEHHIEDFEEWRANLKPPINWHGDYAAEATVGQQIGRLIELVERLILEVRELRKARTP